MNSPSPSPGKSRIHRYTKAVAIRLAACCAVLFILQDKLILRPEIGGKSAVLVTQANWSKPWIENGQYLGRTYSSEPSPKSTILLYHGNAGSIADREPLAQTLTSLGVRVVLVEYPGFGQREGWATMSNALAASKEAFDLAKKRWPGPVFIAGESFGAGMAAQVAGHGKQNVAGVLLFTPWDSLYNVANGKFMQVPVGLLLRHRLDSVFALKDFKGKVQLVAAGADELIPVVHARALAKAIPGAAYLELPNAGHNTWAYELSPRDWQRLLVQLGAIPAPPVAR